MLKQLIEYSGGVPVYIGEAAPGVLASQATWRIKRLTYDGQGNVTAVVYPSGNADFVFVWNDRAGYAYS